MAIRNRIYLCRVKEATRCLWFHDLVQAWPILIVGVFFFLPKTNSRRTMEHSSTYRYQKQSSKTRTYQQLVNGKRREVHIANPALSCSVCWVLRIKREYLALIISFQTKYFKRSAPTAIWSTWVHRCAPLVVWKLRLQRRRPKCQSRHDLLLVPPTSAFSIEPNLGCTFS